MAKKKKKGKKSDHAIKGQTFTLPKFKALLSWEIRCRDKIDIHEDVEISPISEWEIKNYVRQPNPILKIRTSHYRATQRNRSETHLVCLFF